MEKKGVPAWLLSGMGVLAAIVVLGVMYFVGKYALSPQISIQKSLVVGESYPVDGPHPATLKVSRISDEQWSGTVRGDLYITVPEGSKEIYIARFFAYYGGINYECSFYIQFLTPEGVTQTQTWQGCATVNGLNIIPDEIYVK